MLFRHLLLNRSNVIVDLPQRLLDVAVLTLQLESHLTDFRLHLGLDIFNGVFDLAFEAVQLVLPVLHLLLDVVVDEAADVREDVCNLWHLELNVDEVFSHGQVLIQIVVCKEGGAGGVARALLQGLRQVGLGSGEAVSQLRDLVVKLPCVVED